MVLRARHSVLFLAVLSASGVEAQGNAPPCDRSTASDEYAGVQYRLTERAHDGQFAVCDDRRTAVDANSEGWSKKTKKRPIEPVIDNIAAVAWPFEA